MQRRLILPFLIFGWTVAAAVGWGWMACFTSTPGSQIPAPSKLPDSLRTLSQVDLSSNPGSAAGKQRIFVVLHPQCTCSRATLHELIRVVNERDSSADLPTAGQLSAGHDVPNRLNPGPHAFDVILLLYQPSHLPVNWRNDDALAAESLPLHPRVIRDIDGHFAALLHASTSGEVLLYSSNDRLLFQGGITPLRGHEGPSQGAELLLKALDQGVASRLITRVYGCPILPTTAYVPKSISGGATERDYQ